MIGTALAIGGLVSSLAGAGINAWARKKNQKAQEDAAADQRTRNEAWYNNTYHQDYLNSVEGQNAMKKVRDAWAEQNREARARQVISGGTPEQAAAVAEAGAEAMGNTIGNLAAQGQANKQQVDAMKLNMDNNVAQMELEAVKQRYNGLAQSGQNLMQSGMSAMTSGLQNSKQIGSWVDKLNKK